MTSDDLKNQLNLLDRFYCIPLGIRRIDGALVLDQFQKNFGIDGVTDLFNFICSAKREGIKRNIIIETVIHDLSLKNDKISTPRTKGWRVD